MSSFVIEGGYRLSGEIVPQGAKNEALEVICATLLTPEKVTIHNVPDILDVNNLIQLLRDMRVKVEHPSADTYTFQADDVDMEYLSTEEFLRKSGSLRGSVMIVGPLVARFGRALIPKPSPPSPCPAPTSLIIPIWTGISRPTGTTPFMPEAPVCATSSTRPAA